MSAFQRVIALIDMDCFYCQVEARCEPTLQGKPVAVVQYNQWKGGGIIAVNYEARDKGVKRHMRGEEAKQQCPEIILVSVPTIRGKADLSKYRNAGAEVAEVFCQFSDCVERASVDEAYIDLTKKVEERIKDGCCTVKSEDLLNTFVVGFCDINSNEEEQRGKGVKEWLKIMQDEINPNSPAYRLLIGSVIVEEMRAEVYKQTGFHCSAGIAHNKILAKLVAGLHKPKRQTVITQDGVPELYNSIPLQKVRSLGGKMGEEVVERLGISLMSDLYKFSEHELQQKFDHKTANFLYNIARGIDLEPVIVRLVSKSIGCCKRFPGKNALSSKEEVKNWLNELATEVAERLAKDLVDNKRRAKLITVSTYTDTALTRSAPLTSYDSEGITNEAMELIKKFNTAPQNSDEWVPALKHLGISVSKFVEEKHQSIHTFFKPRTNQEKRLPPATVSDKGTLVKDDNNSDSRDGAGSSATLNSSRRKEEAIKRNEKSFFRKYFINHDAKVNICDQESDETKGEENNIERLENEISNSSDEAWISLSELFPDNEDIDEGVVEILPVHMKEELNKRLSVKRNRVSVPSTLRECFNDFSQVKAKQESIPTNCNANNRNSFFMKKLNCEEAVHNNKKVKIQDISDQEEIIEPVTTIDHSGSIDLFEELKQCDECNETVLLHQFTEHLDFHAAQKLHQTLNGRQQAGGITEKKNVLVDNTQKKFRKGGRRGRRKSSPKKGDPQLKMKSITTFFNVAPKT